jgi:serine phosphatase RsbU (regulator of sigma subunit)/beta-galactosidase beta subunit
MKTLKSLSPMARLCLVMLAFIGLYWGCDQSVPEKNKTELTIKDSSEIAKVDKKFDQAMELDNQGKYAEALQLCLAILDEYDKINEKNSVARTYNFIGVLYLRQENDKSALDYFKKSLLMREEILRKNPEDKICQKGKSITLNNIGLLYDRQDQYETAIFYYKGAYKSAESLGDTKDLSLYCNNLGSAYRNLEDYQNSYLYLEKGLKIKREIKDSIGEAVILMNIGITQKKERKFSDSFSNLHRALEIAIVVGNKNLQTEIYTNLAETYATSGNYSKAYDYHRRYSELKENIVNEESTQQVAEMQTKYETEKKEQQIQVLNKDNELQEVKLGRQKITIIAIILFAFIVIIVAIWFFRMYRTSHRKSAIISEQKKEVEKQKGLVDEKNKEMTDSINYASRIQRAMLPKVADIQSALPESFVFYQPKDIVSGDFYWFQKVGDAVFIAAADCTGHGVPGALTSAFCNSALNDAIAITQNPAEMLGFVNNFVKSALKQTDGETKDGMDIALVKITGKTLEYSAANRPLYIVRNGKNEVEETKADKTAIGGFTEDNYRFKLHTLSNMENGDRFYLSSDGFADQFGGPKGKKVTTKHFKEILVSSKDLPIAQQKKMLENFMRDWMPDSHEQVDDFLVIGVEM